MDRQDDKWLDFGTADLLSCGSWVWPHTADPIQFEVRRAVSNLTGGLRETLNPLDPEPSVTDVLQFIEAAHSAQRALEQTLTELTSEAIARGATWAQIGQCLGGIGKQGAHNRFGKGVDAKRKEEMKVESVTLSLLIRVWEGAVPESELGFEDGYWDSTPPEVAISHAWRSLARAWIVLSDDPRRSSTNDDEIGLKRVHRAAEICRRASLTFMTPTAIRTIWSYIQPANAILAWKDKSPMTYVVRAVLMAVLAVNNFGLFLQALREGKEVAATEFMARFCHGIQESMMTLSRPDCIEILAHIEAFVTDSGNVVLRDDSEDPVDMREVLEYVWSEARRSPSLADLLKVLESEETDGQA